MSDRANIAIETYRVHTTFGERFLMRAAWTDDKHMIEINLTPDADPDAWSEADVNVARCGRSMRQAAAVVIAKLGPDYYQDPSEPETDPADVVRSVERVDV